MGTWKGERGDKDSERQRVDYKKTKMISKIEKLKQIRGGRHVRIGLKAKAGYMKHKKDNKHDIERHHAMSPRPMSCRFLPLHFRVLKRAGRSSAVGKQAILRVPFRNYLLP